MPLRVFAYLSRPELPPELASSVRCIVWVGDRLVFCEDPDGRHPRPGRSASPARVRAARRASACVL
jgi:hypothetical protein